MESDLPADRLFCLCASTLSAEPAHVPRTRSLLHSRVNVARPLLQIIQIITLSSFISSDSRGNRFLIVFSFLSMLDLCINGDQFGSLSPRLSIESLFVAHLFLACFFCLFDCLFSPFQVEL